MLDIHPDALDMKWYIVGDGRMVKEEGIVARLKRCRRKRACQDGRCTIVQDHVIYKDPFHLLVFPGYHFVK